MWALTQNGGLGVFMRQDFNQKCRFLGGFLGEKWELKV
jgi:hypothetical protein